MGYHSDVAIQCREEGFRRLKEVWEKYNVRPDSIQHLDDIYRITWKWIKWYEDDFEEIIAIEQTLDQLENEYSELTPELGFCICKIGEELTDIEYRYNDPSLAISVIRDFEPLEGGEKIDIK